MDIVKFYKIKFLIVYHKIGGGASKKLQKNEKAIVSLGFFTRVNV